MNTRTSLSLALLATTGCGLVQVKGLGGATSSPASTAPTAPLAAGAAGGKAATPKGARPELVKAYLAVDFKDYAGNPSGYGDAGVVAKAGLELGKVDSQGKKIYAVTPDTTWLPGWNPGNFSSRDLPMQVAQAGINRTWQAACFADHAAFRAGWKQLESKHGPALTAARAEPNFYARTAALRQLYATVGAEAAASGHEVPPAHAAHWVGLRWEIASELVAAITSTQREAARAHVLGPIAGELPSLMSSGRAWTTDDAFERDAFCLTSQDLGTQRSPKLPRPRQTGWELDVVTYPVSGPRAAEVTTRAAALTANRPALAEPTVLTAETLPNPITTPVLAVFDLEAHPYIVESVKTKGTQTVVHATTSTSSAVGYDCRQTSAVESYTAGGQPLYRKACKTGTRTEVTEVEATFDELPPDGSVKKGAAIAFLGDVSASTTTSKGGGAKLTIRRAVTVRGRFVRAVAATK